MNQEADKLPSSLLDQCKPPNISASPFRATLSARAPPSSLRPRKQDLSLLQDRPEPYRDRPTFELAKARQDNSSHSPIRSSSGYHTEVTAPPPAKLPWVPQGGE